MIEFSTLATGIEDVHKLQAKLKAFHDQLQVNSKETIIPQKIQNDVDALYELCVTVVSKIEQKQSAFKLNIETLTKDKNQLRN